MSGLTQKLLGTYQRDSPTVQRYSFQTRDGRKVGELAETKPRLSPVTGRREARSNGPEEAHERETYVQANMFLLLVPYTISSGAIPRTMTGGLSSIALATCSCQ